VYGVDAQPPLLETLFVGLQHTLAMFAGIVTPPLLIAAGLSLPHGETSFFVSMALFASGISTITQVMRAGPVGSGLLSVQGTSFVFLGPAQAAGAVGGIPLMLGMSMLAAPIEMLLSFCLGFARRLFAPIVTGTAVMMIGFSLIHVGMTNLAGGFGAPDFGSLRHLGLGLFVIAVIVLFYRFGRGIVRVGAVTFGLVAGYALAALLGAVEVGPVRDAEWLLVPAPFHYGYAFDLAFLPPFCMAYLVTTLESVGDMTATSQVSGEPVSGPVYMRRLRGGVLADGLNSVLAAIFNSLPNTTFAQNNGVIQLTGVASRVVGYATAGILMALGVLPKLGALVAVMPRAALGGATVVLFGLVAMAGVRIVAQAGFSGRTMLILAVSCGLGIGVEQVPGALAGVPEGLRHVVGSPLTVGTLTALLLNLVFPHDGPGGADLDLATAGETRASEGRPAAPAAAVDGARGADA
jgi:NCS2 family nucleobase:cation symporter-2/xanthine permease XanP